MTDINGKKRKFNIGKRILMEQSKPPNPKKQFVLEELEFLDEPKETTLRFGYYIIGKKPRMKGKWVWAQYCPIISVDDFEEIISRARKEGILPRHAN